MASPHHEGVISVVVCIFANIEQPGLLLPDVRGTSTVAMSTAYLA